MMHLDAEDHRRVNAAIGAAEERTDGEVIAIVARRSDAYHDAALQWSLLVMLLCFAAVAAFPQAFIGLLEAITGSWHAEWTVRELLTILLAVLTAIFLAARLALNWMPLRLALVPRSTRMRRVRRRAVTLFKVGAERRTASRTGVLLYLSLDEHQAEIVSDRAIHASIPAEAWGAAMALLVDAVRDGRPGDGMVEAIGAIGDLLAQHFPFTGQDPNELPDHIIHV